LIEISLFSILASDQSWTMKLPQLLLVSFRLILDAAGKGGTIKASPKGKPRVFRVVALPAPSDGKNPSCFSSVICSIPCCREVVIFDRSWYNRAGVDM